VEKGKKSKANTFQVSKLKNDGWNGLLGGRRDNRRRSGKIPMSGSQRMALTREKKQRLAAARGWPDGHATCGVRSSFSRRTKPYCHQRKMAADDGNAAADNSVQAVRT